MEATKSDNKVVNPEEKRKQERHEAEMRGKNLSQVSEAAKLAQQLLHTESSTAMSEIKNGRGFQKLEVKVSYKQSRVKAWNKNKLLDYELSNKNPIFDLISDEKTKIAVRNALETFVFEEDSTVNEYSLTFSNGVGSAYMVRIRTLTDPITGDYHYGRIIFTAPHFELAPDYVIVTETEKDFFSSSSTQYIKYIPRGITQDDAKQLILFFADAAHTANNVMLPMMEGDNPLKTLGPAKQHELLEGSKA